MTSRVPTWTVALASVTVLATAVIVDAQVIVDTPKGRVEFIGLETLTPDVIQKQLGYASLDQFHACAADLKKIGFADAAVIADRENGKLYTVVSVVEPAGVDRVQYRPAPTASMSPPGEWHNLLQLIDSGDYVNGVLDYGRTLKGAAHVEPSFSSTEKWWPVLARRRTIADYREAINRLRDDGDSKHRVAAALVLANFSQHDETWAALADAARDPAEQVNITAIQVLLTLTRYKPRKVDWTPATESLRAILNGTNLFAFPHVADSLAKTMVSPRLAAALLGKGSGRTVIAYLAARHQYERTLAHDLLVQMSGQDLGFDTVAWSAWLKSLG